jgi:hypothetical protein
MVSLLEVNRETGSGLTQLTQEFSTFSTDVHGEFLTKADYYYHHLASLQNHIVSVQGRLSAPEW